MLSLLTVNTHGYTMVNYTKKYTHTQRAVTYVVHLIYNVVGCHSIGI